jgi:hypothetical protein
VFLVFLKSAPLATAGRLAFSVNPLWLKRGKP